jgi:RimJ/RimL family protein N-acetyltransferase
VPDAVHVHLVCRREAFRPVPATRARWLEPEADYAAARALWAPFTDLGRAEWLDFWTQGYAYCGIFEQGALVARAAVWRYSDGAWELAAVFVVPERRRRGLAKEVCSLATARILDAGRLATCSTRADNAAMRRTAAALGYAPGPDGGPEAAG